MLAKQTTHARQRIRHVLNRSIMSRMCNHSIIRKIINNTLMAQSEIGRYKEDFPFPRWRLVSLKKDIYQLNNLKNKKKITLT